MEPVLALSKIRSTVQRALCANLHHWNVLRQRFALGRAAELR